MSNKESCGKAETSQRKDSISLPSFNEEDKKDEKASASSSSSACSRRYVSSVKRKLKSDHVDILNCSIKRKHELKSLNEDADTPRKRLRITSPSQGPVTFQEASYLNDNQIISQSPSSDGTRKDISKCVDLKVKDVKLTNVRSNLDHGIKNLSSPKIAKDAKRKAEDQAGGKAWPGVLAQREKMKEPKKERHCKWRDSSEKCVLDKCKRTQFSQDYNSNKIMKEPLESRRRKISFRIPVKSHDSHQKLVEENVFLLDHSKTRTKQKKNGCLESFQVSLNLMRHKSKHLFSDFSYKQAVHELKGKDHHEHQESKDSSSNENLTQSSEAQCSSVSNESIQDTDEEMQIVEELHAARVGKGVGLPVPPRPAELASMEVDLVDSDAPSSAATAASGKQLLIVIDTNILMNHLNYVKSLKTREIPGFDRLVLIIPWIVVQELDRMKEGKLLKCAQHKAIPAVRFINDSLKEQDRKLWGQSIQLASQKIYGLSDENNDDRVLKCCLQYQELYPSSLVILCTDDRNLRTKGLISGVKSLSKEELSAEFFTLTPNTVVHYQPCVSKPQLKAEATPLGDSNEEKSMTPGQLALLEGIVSDLQKSLGTALSSILETEMKIAFGDLWTEMVYLKPPWTVMHLIQCLRKHWVAVFGLIMERKLLSTVESLHENLRKANRAVDFATVKILLQDSQNLLHAFSTRSNYDGVLPQAFAQVNTLLQTLAEERAKCNQNPSGNAVDKMQEDNSPVKSDKQEIPMFSGSHLPQPNKHQEIWSVLESVWITIYENSTDVFQRLGSNSAVSSSKIASFEEAFIYLQKLMAAVKNILGGIQSWLNGAYSKNMPKLFAPFEYVANPGQVKCYLILAPNSTYQDVETLYNILIKYEVNERVQFTAQELYACVSQTEYREKLTIGCGQLAEMERAMQQCHACVYPEARNRGWCDNMLSDES